MKRWMLTGLLMAVAASSLGCTEFQERMISTRNRSWAVTAWHQAKREYPKMPHHLHRHFARGWREGYYTVAQSGSSRIPMLPPQEYWGVHFQNPMGHDEIKAWFEGYQEGTIAAEADGVDYWVKIPTTHLRNRTVVVAAGDIEQIPPGQPVLPHGDEPINPPTPRIEELPPSSTSWSEGAPRLPNANGSK